MTIDFLTSILCIALGLMLSIFTKFSIKIIVIALGAAAVIKGFYDLIKLRRLSEDVAFGRMVIVRALISILVGIIAVSLPLAFFKTAETLLKVMLYILAVFFMISGFLQLFLVAKLDQEEIPTRVLRVEALSYFLISIFLFLVAAISITGIIRIAGIVLVVFGLIYCVYLWHNRALVISPDSIEDVDVVQAEESPAGDE